jgi:hypothetical protein
MASASFAAHPPFTSVVQVKVETDGAITLRIVHDALAYALGLRSGDAADEAMSRLLDGPAAELDAAFASGRSRLEQELHVTTDGSPLSLRIIETPDAAKAAAWSGSHSSDRLPCTLAFVLSGQLPRDAMKLSVQAPPLLGDVLLAIDRPGLERSILPLEAGEESPGIDVAMAWASTTLSPEQTSPDHAASPIAGDESSSLATGARYVKLGFLHIMPEGTDHALFVLGLFLLTPRIKPLLWQVTAFTLAHSVTLTLAALHWVSVPASIVEPAIALSIAAIAAENLWSPRPHRWRPIVAFLFGLAHGLGFASGLVELGLPPQGLASAIIGFNVGVESGHLTVLAAAFLVLGPMTGKPWYRRRVALPLSAIIGVIATYWAISRL